MNKIIKNMSVNNLCIILLRYIYNIKNNYQSNKKILF